MVKPILRRGTGMKTLVGKTIAKLRQPSSQGVLPGILPPEPQKRVLSTEKFRRKSLIEFLKVASFQTGAKKFDSRKGLNEKQAKLLAKDLAKAFFQKEFFDGRRGFTSKERTTSKWIFFPGGKRKMSAFGIDNSIYSLLVAGVSPRGVVRLVYHILSIPAKDFHESKVTEKNKWNTSLDYTHQVLLPKLRPLGILPPVYYKNPDVRDSINHHIDLIVSTGFERELSSRQQDKFKEEKLGYKKLTNKEWAEKQWESKLSTRGDVIELLNKGYSKEEILGMIKLPERKIRGPKKKPNKYATELNSTLPRKKKRMSKILQQENPNQGSLF